MASMEYDDAALQELHDEMYREEEERPKKGFSTIDSKTRFWIGLLAGGIALLVFFDKISTTQGLVMGGIIALIIFLSTGPDTKRKELTMIECLMRAHELLTFLQEHPIGKYPQIPRGEIRIKPVGKKQWFQGQGFKRSIAIDVYDEEMGLTEMYYAEVDIFTGDIITFRHAPEGVIGDEKKDVVFLPTPDMLLQKKRDKYLGQTLYGK
jgi:hypothetical protein